MTSGQAKEAIRDLCSPFTVYDLKKANKAVKSYFGNKLIQMEKTEDEMTTIMWYEISTDEYPAGEDIGFDFWNHQIAEY